MTKLTLCMLLFTQAFFFSDYAAVGSGTSKGLGKFLGQSIEHRTSQKSAGKNLRMSSEFTVYVIE